MSKILRSAPFVTFPIGNGPTPSSELGLGPTLEFLGRSIAGDLYLNQDLTSVGLVCGGLAQDVENTVKRLMASYQSDPDAQVLILHCDRSTIGRKTCPLMRSSGREKILVSPRNPESISRLYESVGGTVVPLCFEEGIVTTQHLLSLFTPPPDMRKRSSILNTIQLVIGQLREPFDLQHFIELIEKEAWSEDGASFMALRQTILTGLLSSQANASFRSQREIIVDLGDPILSSTGMENVMMDMVLQQILSDSPGRKRLIIIYNAHEYLSTNSTLCYSLESLAALGSNSPISIIIAAPSPCNIPLSIFKGIDYMVCGLSRFAVWESTLQDQLSIRLPKSQWDSGRLIVWSPESRSTHGMHYPSDQESPKWNDNLLMIDVQELLETMPERPTHELRESHYSNGLAQPQEDLETPARDSMAALSSHSLLTPEDYEDGIMTLDSININRCDSSSIAHGTEEMDAFDSTSSPIVEKPSYMSMYMRLKELREAREANVVAPGSFTIEQDLPAPLPEWTRVEKKRVVPLENQYPDLFQPLVTAVLKLSTRKTDVWVDFEELRKIVGDKKTLQTLGWGTFTSYVKTSHEQKVLELRYRAGAIKSVKLLPIAVREKYVNSLTPVALALATCPARFRSLVEAILKAGGNDTQAKVLMEDLVTHFIQTPEDLQAFVVRGSNVPYWFQQAIEGKWIRSGKLKNGRAWFGLGSKLQSLAGPKGGPEVHASQQYSPAGDSEAGTDSGIGLF